MSEVSAGYVVFCQSVVGFGGASGLAFSGLTIVFGAQWLLTGTQAARSRLWLIRLQRMVPAGAALLPSVAALFLWPYGIVPR